MTVNDSEEDMRSLVEEGGWTFPVMLNADSVASAYKVPAIPTLVVLDAEGVVVKKLVGGASEAQLVELIEGLAP